MGRNLVLFSDGTGNKGGDGADTNVFKLYHAVMSGKPAAGDRQQITFYDNGVGTSAHAVWRALTGALGFGVRRNVLELYEFAGRHYKPGDHIYGFGFSRGAATMRGFAGMVKHCGLVCRHQTDENGNAYKIPEKKFRKLLRGAMRHYVRRKGMMYFGTMFDFLLNPLGEYDRERYGTDVKIEILGLWDTVAALGLPQLPWLDWVIDRLRRHRFYDFSPTGTVKHVFHAVAIDDERRTFWPLFWNEAAMEKAEQSGANQTHIEQVWFAGVHSNVGGGYPRAGLANLTLDWMLARLDAHHAQARAKVQDETDGEEGEALPGLVLEDSLRSEVKDGINAQGKLYNSRGGGALFYRFQPRPIEARWSSYLCKDKPFRVHSSVLDRMELATAEYAPGQLPARFLEVGSHSSNPADRNGGLESPILGDIDMSAVSGWQDRRAEVDAATNRRIGLYWSFIAFVVLLVGASLYFWAGEIEFAGYGKAWREASAVNWWLGHIADILCYVLPDVFNNLVAYGVKVNPWWGGGVVGFLTLYYVLRFRFRYRADDRAEEVRELVLDKAGRSP